MLATLHIHERAKAQWGKRCPCCTHPMRFLKMRPGHREPKDCATRGHDWPAAHGGKLWIYICRRCNQDQKSRTFLNWARQLIHQNDPRAEHVVAVARFFADNRGHYHVLPGLRNAPLLETLGTGAPGA